jgi:hypothetical protein
MIIGATQPAEAAPTAAFVATTHGVRPNSHESNAAPKGKNNIAGMIVGLVLLSGWTGTGAVMFRRARRRQRLEVPATRDEDSI